MFGIAAKSIAHDTKKPGENSGWTRMSRQPELRN